MLIPVLHYNKTTRFYFIPVTIPYEGGGAQRTKHLRVRQNLVLEHYREGRIMVEYLPTRLMIADSLTKPLQGELHCRFAGVTTGNARL